MQILLNNLKIYAVRSNLVIALRRINGGKEEAKDSRMWGMLSPTVCLCCRFVIISSYDTGAIIIVAFTVHRDQDRIEGGLCSSIVTCLTEGISVTSMKVPKLKHIPRRKSQNPPNFMWFIQCMSSRKPGSSSFSFIILLLTFQNS